MIEKAKVKRQKAKVKAAETARPSSLFNENGAALVNS
jgi:hypothetical protein